MKRYLLFAGRNYYPMGGSNDLIGSFDTACDAIEHHVEYLKQEEDWEFIKDLYDSFDEWWSYQESSRFAHVFDTETMTKVWSWGTN